MDLMTPQPITLVYEDILSYEVLFQLIDHLKPKFQIADKLLGNGFGYIKRLIKGFNHAAKVHPYLILTDLDHNECPVRLLTSWLPEPKHPNLIFRVAIREVESWILADRLGFAEFLGLPQARIPARPELLKDPKKTLVALAARSPKKGLRRDLCPRPGSTAHVGRYFNPRLVAFVRSKWCLERACRRSPSLARALRCLREFQFHGDAPR
jgi:hypothetical protein